MVSFRSPAHADQRRQMVQAEAFAQDCMQVGHNAGWASMSRNGSRQGRSHPSIPLSSPRPVIPRNAVELPGQGLGALADPARIVVNGLVAAREGLLVEHVLDHNVAVKIEQIFLVFVHALHLLRDGSLQALGGKSTIQSGALRSVAGAGFPCTRE